MLNPISAQYICKNTKNIQKSDFMDGFCLQGELDLTLFYKIEGCRVTSLYEHHCYREYCNNLDESSESLSWDELINKECYEKAQ